MGLGYFGRWFKMMYKSNEYCEFKQCEELSKRLKGEPNNCKNCEAYKFHNYLIQKGYTIFKMKVKKN